MSREKAIQLLWEAATYHREVRDGDVWPGSSFAVAGIPVRGDRLYEAGVALGMIEEAKR